MDERPETELEEAVSSFIVFTCRIREIHRSDDICNYHPKPSLRGFKFYSGSIAEFYIIPWSPYFEDIDEMHCHGYIICYFDQIPPLSCDLQYFQDKIQCLRIVSCSEYPGFFQLKYEGNLIYNWNSKNYNFVPIAEPHFVTAGTIEKKEKASKKMLSYFKQFVIVNNASLEAREKQPRSLEICGPAVKLAPRRNVLPYDIVHCFWCPQWPMEAKNWTSRPRNEGWPTAETMTKVVKEGCYIVCVHHRDYEEPLPGFQFRFSFSHAEVILLNSWTPTQQVVYYMLRSVAKRELIQKDCPKNYKALCTYHLKTLMLWTCEEKPVEWWNTNTVVEICRQLLITVSEWLRRRCFPNYFIPTANLISKSVNEESIKIAVERISHFRKPKEINNWFLRNYCHPLFNIFLKTSAITMDITTIRECTARILDKKEALQWKTFNESLSRVQIECMTIIPYQARECCKKWKLGSEDQVSEYLPTDILSQISLNSYFLHMASALLLLTAEYAITCLGMSCDNEFLADLLTSIQMKCKQICRKCHNFPRPYRERLKKSYVLFIRAQELMEVLSGPLDEPEFHLSCRLSMLLLRECIKVQDSKSDSIRDAALAYMAAFFFVNAEFQASLDLCSTVIESQKSIQTIEALSAGCLLYFDDIANITGFFLLWKRCQDRHFCQNHQLNLDLRLTPQVFAMYLMRRLGQSYRKPFPETKLPDRKNNSELYILDVLLILVIRQMRLNSLTSKDRKPFMNFGVSIHKIGGSSLLILFNEKFTNEFGIIPLLLLGLALQRIGDFNSMTFHKFGSQWTCSESYCVLYLYKYRRYDKVLRLCDAILEQPDTTFAAVTVLPPFDSFFDSDIQCLLGLKTLYHFLYSHNERGNLPFSDRELELRKLSADFAQSGEPLIKTLAHPTLEDQVSIGRHFLAKYLKLRCLIDINGPDAEICSSISQINCRFPFEHLVTWFLRQKFTRKPKDSSAVSTTRH